MYTTMIDYKSYLVPGAYSEAYAGAYASRSSLGNKSPLLASDDDAEEERESEAPDTHVLPDEGDEGPDGEDAGFELYEEDEEEEDLA